MALMSGRDPPNRLLHVRAVYDQLSSIVVDTTWTKASSSSSGDSPPLSIYIYMWKNMCAYIFPQQRIRLWGLQSVKQGRGDWGFGSRVPDSVGDVCALDCRNWTWRPQVKIIYLGWQRENAAVFSMEHASLRTEPDPSVLAARERSCLFAGTCFFAHGVRSKCAQSVRTQQCCRMNMSVCVRREIRLCSWRENAAVFSPEHVSLRTERDPNVLTACKCSSLFDGTCLFAHGKRSKCARGVRTQQSFRRNMSHCARSEIQVCSKRANAAVLSHEHLSVPCVRMAIQVAGTSRVLAQQLP